MLTAYFYHKTTRVPLTDPLVTVSVTLSNMNTDAKVLDNSTMSPSSSFPWAFRNSYTPDAEVDYMAYYSCSDSNYVPSVDKVYIPSSGRGGGGGGTINISGIQTSISNSRDSIIKEFDKKLIEMEERIKQEFNDTNSHIDIAKEQVITTIEGIEIPESVLEEKEAKKAVKLLTTVDKKLTGYIDMENKDKYDLMKEFESKMSEKEDEMNTKISEKEELIQEMEEVAKELMDELQKESQSDKEKTIQEVKEKIISSLSE